jgi:hypothetical protein
MGEASRRAVGEMRKQGSEYVESTLYACTKTINETH